MQSAQFFCGPLGRPHTWKGVRSRRPGWHREVFRAYTHPEAAFLKGISEFVNEGVFLRGTPNVIYGYSLSLKEGDGHET